MVELTGSVWPGEGGVQLPPLLLRASMSRRAMITGLQRAVLRTRGAVPAQFRVVQHAPAGDRAFRSSPALAGKGGESKKPRLNCEG